MAVFAQEGVSLSGCAMCSASEVAGLQKPGSVGTYLLFGVTGANSERDHHKRDLKV